MSSVADDTDAPAPPWMVPVGLGVAVLAVVLAIVGLVLSFTAPQGHDLKPVSKAIYESGPIVIAIVGGALFASRPRHWSGRAMLTIAFALAIDTPAKGVLGHYTAKESWAAPLAPWATWFDDWTWTFGFVGLLVTLIKFAGRGPEGRRIRALAWVGVPVLVLMAIVCALAPNTDSGYRYARAPFAALPLDFVNSVVGIGFALVIGAMVLATVALVIRYRHAGAVGRAQLRWLLWSFSTIVILIIVASAVENASSAGYLDAPLLNDGLSAVQELSIVTLPIAVFFSVTRYGLFEIDRVISRTASYTALTALLTAVYIVVVTSAARLVPDRFGSVPVAMATLAVVAVFVPLRRRATHVIDRRFNRGRYNAERVVAAFADRMRVQDAVDPTGADLLVAVRMVLQPEHAGVWLAPSGRASGS